MVHRKIEMELVKSKSSRLVTFSKRRKGLLKKASELSILCGAQVAMFVFSLAGKPFTFGSPSVQAVTNKFFQFHQEEPEPDGGHCKPSKDGKRKRLDQKLTDLMNELQVKKKKKKKKKEMLDNALNKNTLINGKFSIAGLNLVGRQKLKASLEELSDNLKARMNEMEASSSLLLLAEKPVK